MVVEEGECGDSHGDYEDGEGFEDLSWDEGGYAGVVELVLWVWDGIGDGVLFCKDVRW